MSNRTLIPAEVDAQYQRELLYRPVPRMIYERFAKEINVDVHGGSRTMRLRRYNNLNPALTPLTEGVTPSGSTVSVTTITKTLAQYGDFTPFTDVVTLESADPVISEIIGVSGDQLGMTRDVLCREGLFSGTSVFFGGGRLSRGAVATGDYVTVTMLDKIVESLSDGLALKITGLVTASDGIGTTSVMPSYIGFCDFNVYRQLKTLSTWTPAKNYASTSGTYPGEIGSTENIRWIMVDNKKVYTGAGAGSINVHGFVVFGQNAYCKSKMDRSTTEAIIKPLGSGGTEDPLNQRGTVGWIGTMGFFILNDAFIIRGEVAELP